MKRLKWETNEHGWVARTENTTLILSEKTYIAHLFNRDYQVAGTFIPASTPQGAKRAAVQWAKGVVLGLAKEWE